MILQPEQKPIEKLKLKLCTFDELYSVSRIWADSDKKTRIYSSANIAENLMLVIVPLVGISSSFLPDIQHNLGNGYIDT
jgi:hypothetical protein